MNFYKKTSSEEKDQGFTVLEALVAFAILAIAFGAFTSSTTTSIKAFQHAEKMHIASKIAKEGLELIINKKVNHRSCADNFLHSDCVFEESWKDFVDLDKSYEVSSARPEELLPKVVLKEYNPRYLCFLDQGLDRHGGKFGYCNPDMFGETDGPGRTIPGNFTREIKFEDLGDGSGPLEPSAVRVQSVVKWDNGRKEVILEVVLFD